MRMDGKEFINCAVQSKFNLLSIRNSKFIIETYLRITIPMFAGINEG